jgi:hypothetical protein
MKIVYILYAYGKDNPISEHMQKLFDDQLQSRHRDRKRLSA